MLDPVTLSSKIKEEALRLGFDQVGIAPVTPSEHGEFLRKWLAEGKHGEMQYLARTDAVENRVRPWPELRSAVVVALNYYQDEDEGEGAGVIARYALGRDYHKVIKAKLLKLLRFVESEAGHALPAARAYVDTGPVLERELAQRAGLGWFGRNTMLVNPKRGSFFFLGSLLLELELQYDAPFAEEHCGTCSACVSACPTGALLGRDESGAPVMDARRCISYLTIENRGPIPVELRPLIGNRIYGCDICQDVCPWNSPKFVQLSGEADFARRDYVVNRRLVDLMRMSYDDWDAYTRGSAIRRAGYAGFRRNVAVALGNWLAQSAEPAEDAIAVLRDALKDAEPLVREHAQWALEQIGQD